MLVVLTFVLTTGLYGALLYWSFRKVAHHLQGSEAARKAVFDHVITPLFARQKEVILADEVEDEHDRA